MDFIGAYWWLWLVISIGSVLFLFFSIYSKAKKLAEIESIPGKTGEKSLIKALVLLVTTWVICVVSWGLFFCSIIVNILHWVVHLVKTT